MQISDYKIIQSFQNKGFNDLKKTEKQSFLNHKKYYAQMPLFH